MSLDSRDEAKYRADLADGHLERARKALSRADFADTVSEAQLSIENAAKAVISCFQIPSWSHDPSEELKDIIEDNKSRILNLLGPDFPRILEELADSAHTVAPEHGRATYGDVQRRVPPWELYSEQDARKVLEKAERACGAARRFIKSWYAS